MTTNKIPTDEEIIMNILGCETKDDLIGWKNGEKGQFSYGDIEVAIKHARAAGRAQGAEEQREKLLPLLKQSLKFYREELEYIGGCDHTVGICVCRLIREADDLEEAIRTQPTNKEEK